MAAIVFAVLFFLATGIGTFADVEIKIHPHNGSRAALHSYSDYKPFRRQFSNTGSAILNGTLHQPVPNYDGCLPLQNITIEKNKHHKWFVLVDNYPASCGVDTIVKNVKASNYTLMIASSQGNIHHSVSDEDDRQMKLQKFSMVIISDKYADYLKEHALTDPNNFNLSTSIIVFVNTSNTTTEMLIFWVVIITCTILFILFCLVLRWKSVSKRRKQDGPPETDIEGVDRSRHRSTSRREQLINSYFDRQLERMYGQFHSPLSREQVRKLPVQRYRVSKGDVRSSCAICVDEFVNGALVRVLLCGHTFHSECIDKWFVRYSSLCPLCKRDISKEFMPTGDAKKDMNSTFPDDLNNSLLRSSTPVKLQQYGSIS